MASLWRLLQTSDSAFPVGGFAHSYGLEGMVQAGAVNTPADLREFIEATWIPVLTHIDLPLVRLAAAHAGDRAALLRLDELAWACRPTAEARKAQQQMGAQRLTLMTGLTGNEQLSAMQNERWMTQWPVVWGLETAALGTELMSSLTAYAYQGINGILTASTKLIRIGPSELQRQLQDAGPSVEKAIDASLSISEDEIGWFTPMLDITGAAHETAYTRIFIS